MIGDRVAPEELDERDEQDEDPDADWEQMQDEGVFPEWIS